MSPLGLYLHVPFCASICSYCNFNRGLFDAGLKDRYVRALRDEIRFVSGHVNAGRHPVTGRPLPNASSDVDRPRTSDFVVRQAHHALGLSKGGPRTTASGRKAADTIYFGGGTPSLLSAEEIGSLIDACRSAFHLAPDTEITLEANPETVTVETMTAYRAVGVNRVSIGVQSFRDQELRRLGRIHDAARAHTALDAIRSAGIDNVSLDLMLWLPQQTVEDCLFSVRTLAGLQPAHASLYLLELYPNAPLKEAMARSGWSLAPDEDAAKMYLRALEVLADAGCQQYEISNFARPGLACRHNLKYWSDGEWLAFGCGAHSTMEGVRWKNVSATDSYIRGLEAGGGPVVAERRELSLVEQFQEAMFMGLRLVSGIDLQDIERRYGIDVWQRYGGRLAPFVEAGLLLREPATLRLSHRGLLLSNEVMAVFLE